MCQQKYMVHVNRLNSRHVAYIHPIWETCQQNPKYDLSGTDLLCNYRYNSLHIATLQNMQETRVDQELIVT